MKTVKPTVRIFMENSGSMNGFVTINSEFKNALGHLIAKTNGFYEGTKLFFINDAIHHAAVCDNLNDFVLHLNPQTMQVGNTGSTDINKIFGMILDRTKNDTVSILVSDCVYDVDNVGNLLSAASSSTTGTFMKAIRQAKEKDSDFAVILMQCESKFYGYHYEDIIGGDAVIDPKEHARSEGGQRDAYITRSWNGKGFVMVTTDMCVAKSRKWDNYGIDLMKSDDLLHWTSVTFDYRKGTSIFCNPGAESVYKDWSTINRVWAPQIF